MSRDVRDKTHDGYNFESNLNQTQNCKVKETFANCGVDFQKHCTCIDTVLSSPISCP